MLFSLAAGNAVRVHLQPATGAEVMRVLRKSADTFVDQDDPAATVVGDGLTVEPFVLDSADDLLNGVVAYYRGYDFVGGTWVDQGQTFSVVPGCTYRTDDLDVQEFVRDRFQLGVTSAIAAQALHPPSGAIQVTTAPFALPEATTFPTVCIHLEQISQDMRVIGDAMQDYFDEPTGEWITTEGWLSRVTLNVVGVSQNPDERIQLRKVLRQIFIANIPIFGAVGIVTPEFSQTDSEQFSENNVPLYYSNGVLNLVAPDWIKVPEGLLSDVTFNPGFAWPPEQPTPDYLGDLHV
jgi:hypothetical protein